MAPKRRPLLHSKSLYQPPLTRSSQSSPGPNHLPANRSPIFSPSQSYSSEPQISQEDKLQLKGSRSYSLSTRRTTLKTHSYSISAQTSQEHADKKSSGGSISEQFSAFINVSSQMGLQVIKIYVWEPTPHQLPTLAVQCPPTVQHNLFVTKNLFPVIGQALAK